MRVRPVDVDDPDLVRLGLGRERDPLESELSAIGGPVLRVVELVRGWERYLGFVAPVRVDDEQRPARMVGR